MANFIFEGVHPTTLDGRLLRARLSIKNGKRNLIIDEYKICVKSSEKALRLFKEFCIPLPEVLCTNDGHNRMIGNPVCIGCHRQFIILQYVTQHEPFIQFMIVDTERKLARVCNLSSRHFLREYCLTAPLECYLDIDTPSCMMRLSPTMLRIQRSLSIQSVLFAHSGSLGDDKEDFLQRVDVMSGFKDVLTVRNTRFLNIISVEKGKNLLVTVNEFCSKFTFEMLDTSTLVTTKLAARGVSSDCQCLYQSKVCRTRAADLIIVACLTSSKEDDFTSTCQLQVFTFEMNTFTNVSKYRYDVAKWFGSEVDKNSGEIMLTVSCTDKMLETWHAKRQSNPVFIKSFRLSRVDVLTLKSQCRSTILSYANEWELKKLGVPGKLELYLRFNENGHT